MSELTIPDVKDILTSTQIQFFKENGYLILEDFIETARINLWRDEIREFFGADPEDEKSWNVNVNGRSSGDLIFSQESSLKNHSGLSEIIKTLGGGTFNIESELLLTTPSKPELKWSEPEKGHIDLFLPNYKSRFMLNATTYVYEVLHKGGAFTLWARSHTANWDHFRKFPDDYYAQDLNRVNKLLTQNAACEPIEFTAKPGTVLLWHSFLLHSASLNTSKSRRTGIFCRWGQKMKIGEVRETFGDIWENWSI